MKLFSLLFHFITVTLLAYLFNTPEANLQAWEEQQENEWTERGRQREVQGRKEGVKAVQRLKKKKNVHLRAFLDALLHPSTSQSLRSLKETTLDDI